MTRRVRRIAMKCSLLESHLCWHFEKKCRCNRGDACSFRHAEAQTPKEDKKPVRPPVPPLLGLAKIGKPVMDDTATNPQFANKMMAMHVEKKAAEKGNGRTRDSISTLA